jgi:hypothetical protein
LRARLDARWGNALGASLAALGTLAGALGATAATAAPLPPFCFLAGLGGSFLRRPVAVALAATALASAFGVAITKQKMEELLGAGCDGEDLLTQGANGWPDRCAAHTMMASIHSL